MSTAPELIFGIPAEWKAFGERHALFLQRFPHLKAALNTAFLRRGSSVDPIDRFVFFYGRLCCEDFFEVLLCCGNGYGTAALKLVRTLYERAVTLLYLHEHPDELQDFLDYHHVAQHKLLLSFQQTIDDKVVSEEVATDVRQHYEEVKDRFMITDCKTCGTKRLNHTWNKLDLVAMAKKTRLGEIVALGYYLPLRQAHATLASLFTRLETTDDGGVTFLPEAQRDEADQALIVAHNVILQVLGVQEQRFKLPQLTEQIHDCLVDFQDIYSRPEQPLTSSEPDNASSTK